jgi:tetratricopeptide (TPR) repeat protein
MKPFLFLPVLALAFWMACKNEPKPAAGPAGGQQDPELLELSQALASRPNDDSLLYRRARVYYRLEGYDEALADLAQAMRLDSMQPAYYHLLADVLLDYGRPNDSRRAIDVLTLASERFPDRLPTLLKLSEFQLIVRQHGEALKTLDQILQRDPQNAEALFMSGRVALDKGDTTNAIAVLKKSVQLDAGNADAWLFLGRIYSNRNDAAAVQYFDNALRLDTANLEVMEYKAVHYKRRGEFDQAFALYRDIIRRSPDYSNAYFDMGMIYLELDSLNKAYDNFDIAVKTDPLFVKAYYYRGVAAENRGDLEAALADYIQANKMSPKFIEAKEARERLEKK